MATTLNLGRVKGSFIYTGTGTDDASIKSDLLARGITALNYDLYIGNADQKLYQYQISEGAGNWIYLFTMKGDTGTGFSISKTYSSVAAMNAGYATDGVPIGGFVLINTDDVDDPDNAKLYVKGETQYDYLTDLSGAQGIQGRPGQDGGPGPAGAAATIQVGTVTTGDAGTQAQVTNAGTANAAVFNFVIPRGANGTDGKDGTQGPAGTSATIQIGTVTTGAAGSQAQVTNSGNATAAVFNFVIPRGDKGADGAAGADGKTPTLTINENGELVATFE